MSEEEKAKDSLNKMNDNLKDFKKNGNDIESIRKVLVLIKAFPVGEDHVDINAAENTVTNFITQNSSTGKGGSLNAKKISIEDIVKCIKKLAEAKNVEWDSIVGKN